MKVRRDRRGTEEGMPNREACGSGILSEALDCKLGLFVHSFL